MHAYLAIAAVALAAPALAAADPLPRDRLGYEREIEPSRYNQVPKPKLLDYVLSDEYRAAQKKRVNLITRYRPEEAVAFDNVILESNIVKVVRPPRNHIEGDSSEGEGLVRRRRGYNLEHVNVPARYPYLPVPSYYRVRRWG